MGSRYDVAVIRNVTLGQFIEAYTGHSTVVEPASGPWEGPTRVTVAQIDTARGRNVVVVAPAMESPRGLDTSLANKLATEILCATVRDSVGVYSLIVVGPGVDRHFSVEPDADDGMVVYDTGERLPEEPDWPDLDEAYIQTVLEGRCGIDPWLLGVQDDATWYVLPPLERERRPRRARPADAGASETTRPASS